MMLLDIGDLVFFDLYDLLFFGLDMYLLIARSLYRWVDLMMFVCTMYEDVLCCVDTFGWLICRSFLGGWSCN